MNKRTALQPNGVVPPRLAPVTLDAQRRLVDIWLTLDGQSGKQILETFRLGYEEGFAAPHGSASPSKALAAEERSDDVFVTEKIEAYNVAIEALLNHEPADGDATGLARRLRRALAHKLDKEIQRWCDALPPNAELCDAAPPAASNTTKP